MVLERMRPVRPMQQETEIAFTSRLIPESEED